MDFRPVFIAFALRRLDTVLNVDKQTNAAAICAGSFRSAGAFAAYPFSDSITSPVFQKKLVLMLKGSWWIKTKV